MKEEDLDMALLWIEKNKERIEKLLAEIVDKERIENLLGEILKEVEVTRKYLRVLLRR